MRIPNIWGKEGVMVTGAHGTGNPVRGSNQVRDKEALIVK